MRALLANLLLGLVLLAWLAYGVAGVYVEQKLIDFYGSPDLPRGEDRWNPRIYEDGAERWIERDRLLHRYQTRAWLALGIGGMLIAWAIKSL